MNTFRIAPEYRRIGWYLTVGALLILLAIWYLPPSHERPAAHLRQLWFSGVLVCLVGLFAVWFHHIRFRLAEDGLARRVFIWWDLWPWETLASGQVQYIAENYAFKDPRRSWWRRTLSLSFLDHADRRVLLDACMMHWRPPEVEPVDEITLSIQRRFLWRTRVHFDGGGITVVESGRESVHPWREVESVWVSRHSPGQTDFRTLCLVLPGRKVVLTKNCNYISQDWRGPDGAAVFAFLSRHLPGEKVHVGHQFGDSPSLDDLLLRILLYRKRVSKARRDCTLALPILVGAGAYLLVTGVWDGRETLAFVATFGYLLVAGGLFVLGMRKLQRTIRDAETTALGILGVARLDATLDETKFHVLVR